LERNCWKSKAKEIAHSKPKSLPKTAHLHVWSWRVSLNAIYLFEILRNFEERGIERTFNELGHKGLVIGMGVFIVWPHLFEPVIAHAHLDSVELWIPNAQICIGDVPPIAANFDRLLAFCEYLNSTATAGGEVETRSVSYR
jgi:hypothetical protein